MKFFILVLACIPLTLAVFFSILINNQMGIFNWYESNHYIVHYLNDTSLGSKIFNYHGTDVLIYRPRDLGNVFNLLDTYALLGMAKMGITNFLSPINYLSTSSCHGFLALALAQSSSFS